jgi:hypothetical protein
MRPARIFFKNSYNNKIQVSSLPVVASRSILSFSLIKEPVDLLYSFPLKKNYPPYPL